MKRTILGTTVLMPAISVKMDLCGDLGLVELVTWLHYTLMIPGVIFKQKVILQPQFILLTIPLIQILEKIDMLVSMWVISHPLKNVTSQLRPCLIQEIILMNIIRIIMILMMMVNRYPKLGILLLNWPLIPLSIQMTPIVDPLHVIGRTPHFVLMKILNTNGTWQCGPKIFTPLLLLFMTP